MILIAVVIGFLGGFGAVGIQYLIKLFQELVWGDWNLNLDYLKNVSIPVKILAPTIGGLFVGLIVFLVAKEAKGHGVPEVMESIALRNGVIRARVVLAKLLASSICIGSGGSTGREGPVIQIGASVGSTIGQFLRVNPERMKIFVACGAAAGIAAAFNAPVAGALFSVEVILGDFGVAQFSPIVIASVVATVVSRWFLGNYPAFKVPEYQLVSPVELIPYAILGIIAGLVALMFIKVLYSIEDYFEKMKLHAVIQTMLGGLMIGIMGIFVPHIYGIGYNSMDQALQGELPWLLMFGLIFFKIFATSISLGSGGSGGIFAPALFLGTMTGGFFGALVHKVIPDHSATSGAYSLVGMGAVVAGATHAPITAILIIFEMTGDYAIILPLMISAIIATVLTTKLKKESIYTLKLVRRGVDLFRGREVNILRALTVSKIMNTKPVIIPPDLTFTELLELVVSQPNTHFFVVNQENELLGSVSLQDVRGVLLDQDYITDWLIAMDLVNSNIPRVEANDDLGSVMKLFGIYDTEEIPVVDSIEKKHIVGSVERRDIINIYNKELVKKNLSQEISGSLKLLDKIQTVDFIDDHMMAELPIPSSFIGKSIIEIDIRAKYNVQILMIKRLTESGDYKQIVPSPGEKLVKEDFLVVMAKNKDIENFKHVS
jgi:CIC family chloride channel protein